MKIARYIQLPQFVYMLSEGLFIPKTSLFEDELEGLASVIFNRYDEGPAPKMENDWAKEWIYTSCWYKSTEESMAMWNLYGTNNESLMVQSTTDKLASALSSSKKYKSYPARLNFVSYFEAAEYPRPLYKKDVHSRSAAPCQHLYNQKLDDFFYKHPSYRHEQEVRLCIIEKSAESPYEKNKIAGVVLPIQNDFIESVVFAPNATGWFKDIVKELMRKYDIDAEIKGSELDWHKEIFSPNTIMF
ncbi:DUF2971 domain-containing protein [Shewanella sp.]|uniref:DUF2971 domain-containing protein n=1 Tax=Shewanella sp. TaxID=50422 RepID=UPI00356ADD69